MSDEICYNDGPPHPRTECHEDYCGLDPVHSCGYPEGTFACKIRHLSINTGSAKAAND